MRASRKTPQGRRRQRGAALAVTGIAMLMLVGLAAIGVDVGHLAFTANETQTLADLSATSYAKTMARNRDDGGSRDPVAETSVVVERNAIGGSGATIPVNIESFEEGNFDLDTRTFQAGATPINAVRATAKATVPNFFAGVFGDTESTVTRQATAALLPPSGAPVLPLAIGECHWNIFESTGNCASQPEFELVPDPDETACWTSLTPNVGDANADWFRSAILRYCGLEQGPLPDVTVGDTIALNDGKVTPALRAIQDCVNAGFTEFLVPVIPCNKCNQSDEILGFATINVTDVVPAGQNAGLSAEAVCSTDAPGATGGGHAQMTGTEIVLMVE